MASSVSLRSQPFNDFPLAQSKWGTATTTTTTTTTSADQASTQLHCQLSDIILKSSQNDLSSVPTFGEDEVSAGFRYHLAVETNLEKKSTASDGRRPRIVLKFRTQSKDRIDDTITNEADKTLVPINGEKSGKDETLENKSTASEERVKDPSKVTEGQTLVATDCNAGSPVQNESTQLGFVPKEKEDKKKRPFSTFSVSLTRADIEADLLAMSGGKRIKRGKKRPKIVQKQLDHLFPGLRLKYITPDDYRVGDEI